jgi:hypothetical protein
MTAYKTLFTNFDRSIRRAIGHLLRLFIKISKSIPKPHFKALLWAQNHICMGPLNLKMGLSNNVCLISNRSKEKIRL